MVAIRKPSSSSPGMTVAEFPDWSGDGSDTGCELVNGEPCAPGRCPSRPTPG